MKTSDLVSTTFEEAVKVLDKKDALYGNSWIKSGQETCLYEVFRTTSSIKAQYMRGNVKAEDLLDLINWAAFSYLHITRGDLNETSPSM